MLWGLAIPRNPIPRNPLWSQPLGGYDSIVFLPGHSGHRQVVKQPSFLLRVFQRSTDKTLSTSLPAHLLVSPSLPCTVFWEQAHHNSEARLATATPGDMLIKLRVWTEREAWAEGKCGRGWQTADPSFTALQRRGRNNSTSEARTDASAGSFSLGLHWGGL